MKYGIVDIGSNTMRLNLYGVDSEGNFESLLNKKSVAGLASYVENGYLSKKGVDKIVNVVNKFNTICQHFDIEKVSIFATASIRNAKNSPDVIKYVEEHTGSKINLLTEEEEANFGYHGISDDYNIENGYIVDIGGGSTELTLIENGSVAFSTSLPQGSLSLLRKFADEIFPKGGELQSMKHYIRALLKSSGIPEGLEYPVYGAGGTIRACGNISQEYFDLTSNKELSRGLVKKLSKKLYNRDIDVLKTVLQVSPERIHTIVPGMVIFREVLRYTKSKDIYISKNGVREGYLMRCIENV